MFQITISGKTKEELITSATSLVALLGGTAAAALSILSASDQARLRGDATVVPPKADKEPTAAEKKAAEKAAKKAAEDAAKAAAAEVEDEAIDDGDPLGENDEAEGEALTREDVKALLIEVRGAYPKEATIISQIVREHGKQAKISDVDEKLLPKVAARCRELLKKAGK